MNKKNLQGGFAPLLVIAIIAILAIGGGVYIAKKNREAGTPRANENAQENANVNANLGVNAKTNVSLRSLLGLKQNTMCTFSRTSSNTTSSGTVYIGSDGRMSGDFESKTGTNAAVTSHMIVKDGVTYAWTGTQGAKMNIADIDMSSKTNANVSVDTKKYADLDAKGDYKCSPWIRDESKFTIPVNVNFIDINALMKVNSGIKINGSGY